MSRHLLQLLTQAGPAKEIRVFGLGDELRRRQREAWDASTEELSRAELRAAAARSGGQLVFVIGYVGALALVVQEAIGGTQSVGAVLFTAILASQITIQTVDDRPAHEPDAVDDARRRRPQLAARRRRAPGADAASPTCRCPTAIEDGLAFEDVSFSYPGSERPILERRRPAAARRRGRRARRRERRRQDDARQADRPLLRADAPARSRSTARTSAASTSPSGASSLTAGFQDFARLEVLARETVGVGDLPNLEATPVVEDALERAHAADVVATLPDGPRDAARAVVGERQRALGRPVAEARARPDDDARAGRSSCCSTSRPRRSTPTPSTCSSSSTPRPRARRRATIGRDHAARLAPLLDRAHGRPDPRRRRRPDRRARHARGADARSAARTPTCTGCRRARTARRERRRRGRRPTVLAAAEDREEEAGRRSGRRGRSRPRAAARRGCPSPSAGAGSRPS